MFKELFSLDETVRRYSTAPLAPSRLSYLSHRAEQGAKPYTLKRIAIAQLAAVQFLDLAQPGPIQLQDLEAAAGRWVREQPGRRGGQAERAVRRIVCPVAGWLRFVDRLIEVPEGEASPHADRIAAFADYMRRERGWSEETVSFRVRVVEEFLRGLTVEHCSLEQVTLACVDRALAGKMGRDGWSRNSVRTYAMALRSFFRFAEQQAWCTEGLAAGIVPPRVYWGEGLPLGPSWEDVQRLIAAAAGNLRDHALLLLLSRYGFRASEVSRLRLEDIDWESCTLTVRRSKASRSDRYPLSREVGSAVLSYLREARPRGAWREIFLTLVAPIGPLTPSGVSGVVARRMRQLGIRSPQCGAHALRHACAQRLLDEGFSMKTIGDHLGHAWPDSTAAYAKVDLASLRQVADFDFAWEVSA